MLKCFTILYKLSEKQNGALVPFSKTKGVYTANLVADSQEDAVNKLMASFNMLVVEVLDCKEGSMTEEEYNNG